MNDRVLEADDTALVEPDDWAFAEPKAAPLSISDELQRQVDEFLAQGGRIQTFETGETAIGVNQPLWSFPAGKAATPDQQRRKEADANRLRKVVTRHAGDAVLVAKLNLELGNAKSLTDLCQVCNCSSEKLWRIFRDHFSDDKRADRFRKRTREQGILDRENALLAKIKQAQADGIRGVWNLAKHCGVSYDRLSMLNKKHKLGLVLGKGDNREGREPSAPKRAYKGNAQCRNDACRAAVVASAHYCQSCGTITDRGLEKGSEA